VATEGAGLFQFDGDAWRQAPDMPGMGLPVYSSLWMAQDGRLWAHSSSTMGLSYLQGQVWHEVSREIRPAGRAGALTRSSSTKRASGIGRVRRRSNGSIVGGPGEMRLSPG